MAITPLFWMVCNCMAEDMQFTSLAIFPLANYPEYAKISTLITGVRSASLDVPEPRAL